MIKLKCKSGVRGFYRIEAVKPDGTRREIGGWFENLITNGGLDRMGDQSDWLTFCQVGSGSVDPTFAGSTLTNRVAGTSNSPSTVSGSQASSPYFTWRRNVYRFNAGTATGNLSEIGIGWASSGGLFSWSLIKDTDGSPTTITIQSDEILDVTYEVRMYPITTDSTGVLNIAGTDYNYIVRAANVTSNNNTTGWEIAQNGTSARSVGGGTGATRTGEGSIGLITGSSGGAVNRDGGSTSAYVAGSYENTAQFTWNIGSSNFATGIGSIRWIHGWGNFQIGFTPKVPKTNTDVFTITVKHTWARTA